jgi:signal transduction histidine kinase
VVYARPEILVLFPSNPKPVTFHHLHKQALLAIILVGCCFVSHAQSSASLLADLQKAGTANQKADILYLISSRYANFLKIDSSLYYAGKIKEISEQNNYRAGIGKYWLATASALRFRSKFEEARESLQKAIAIFEKEKNFTFLGKSYEILATTYSIPGDNLASVAYYRKAIEYTTLAKDTFSLSKQYFEIGKVFYHSFSTDSAIIYLTKALSIAEILKDGQRIFLIAGSIGSLFLATDNYPEARRYLEYSLRNQSGMSDIISLLLRLGDYTDCLIKLHAFTLADSVLKVFESTAPKKDEWCQAFLNDLKGSLQYAQGNYPEALDFYQAAYTLPLIEMEFANKTIIFDLGKTEVQLGRYRDAITHLHEAKKLHNTLKFAPNGMLVDSLISECFVKIGRPDSALQYFRSYEVLKDSVRSVQKLKTIMDVSARYETEKKEQEIKILEKEAAYQKLLAKNHNQQKNIAWISIALIMAGGGYFTYRYIRKRKLQNQQVVLNERLRISRELHDEVGSTLSGIAMVSHLTKEQIKAAKTEQVEKSLSTINQSATEMVGKLNDIIWLVNPGKDSFQQLIERLDEFATEVAGTKDIDLKINVETDLAQVDLPVDKRREIYLFCKEAINNAIKYSNAGLITLTIRETDNKKINVFITDNGDGFDPLRVRKGNGLTNMQQRVEKINGEYLLQTSPGSGTKHSLLFKIT